MGHVTPRQISRHFTRVTLPINSHENRAKKESLIIEKSENFHNQSETQLPENQESETLAQKSSKSGGGQRLFLNGEKGSTLIPNDGKYGIRTNLPRKQLIIEMR
jgi:hypothetical protein